MSAELSLDSNEIESLAGQINEAISGVMNVDQVKLQLQFCTFFLNYIYAFICE